MICQSPALALVKAASNRPPSALSQCYRVRLPRGDRDRQRHLGQKRSIRGDFKAVNHKHRWLVEFRPEGYF